jgi:hypothetical protein
MSVTTGNPAHVQQVEKLLKVMLDNGGTEVRLSAGVAPMVRIDGSLKPMGSKPLTADVVTALTAAIVPAGSDSSRFVFDAAAGPCEGSLLDIDGTKVLVLRAPAAIDDAPLELATTADDGMFAASGDGSTGDAYAMPEAAGGTIQIDKLLMAAVKGGVSDIHITTGLPPVFRIDGGMRPQKTKVLTADDTNALMKAITPERCQAELAEKGGTDFGFAFKDLARFRVSVFKQRGQVAMVLRQIPNKLLTPEQLGARSSSPAPAVCSSSPARPAPARAPPWPP